MDKKTSKNNAPTYYKDVSFAKHNPPYGMIIGAIVIAILLIQAVYIVSHNPNFEWPVVAKYLTNSAVIQGLQMTIWLTIISMIIGVVIGLMLAIAKISQNPIWRGLSSAYIWVFRGTPLLVQLLFWYNLSSLFPQISLGIPLGPTLFSWNTNSLITPLTAGIAGLALNEAAYMAEITRAGLISVDPKQMETARSFGMSHSRAYRRIVIPQAMRAIVPPTSNQVINMVKATSMVSMIAMGDLLHAVQDIYNANFEVIPLLLVAVTWYLLITSILSLLQNYIENYYNKADRYVHKRWKEKFFSTPTKSTPTKSTQAKKNGAETLAKSNHVISTGEHL